jgi:replicative DNA helicase
MELKIFDVLNQRIGERVMDLSRTLSEGVAKDHADYKEMCGVIRGLQTAQYELNDLLRKIKEDDDE